jgi:hypothetical protein
LKWKKQAIEDLKAYHNVDISKEIKYLTEQFYSEMIKMKIYYWEMFREKNVL